ncbi:MAG TPA: nuclear transport factor 2 family protein [Myxococcota bacterium]|nr:nuclear transport factor 2 family protein [Myxococcota bacterium]
MSRSVSDRVADELAIRNLVARYCHSIAERDFETWASSWAEDGEWHVLGQTVRGRAEILARYRALTGATRLVIQVASDGVIEVDGDMASGRWQMTETIQTQDGRAALNLGRYLDRYRRDADGAWRFTRREFQTRYLGPPDLSAPPAPR